MASVESDGGRDPASLSSSSHPSEQDTIDLRILSPSSGFPQDGLSFPNLPVATTAGELKRMIQHAIETKPDPARQRLIYRGRVVGRDIDQLADVFGREQIQQSRAQNLHLVLSDPSSLSGPRSATAPPNQNPFRPVPAPPSFSPPVATNPFRGPNAAAQANIPRPQSQPPAQAAPRQPQQVHVHAPVGVPPGMFGNMDVMNQIMQQHMALAQQQIMGQLPPGIQNLPQIQQQIQQQLAEQMPTLQAQIVDHQRRSGQNTPAAESGNPLGINPPRPPNPALRVPSGSTSDGESTTDTDETSSSGTDGDDSSADERTPAATAPSAQQAQTPQAPGNAQNAPRTIIPNMFQEVIAQHQQQRASSAPQPNGSQGSELPRAQERSASASAQRAGTPLNQRAPANRSTYVAEGTLPNGHRYTMTINSNVQLPNAGFGAPGAGNAATPTSAPNNQQPPVPVVPGDVHPPYPHTHPGQTHVHHHQGTPAPPPPTGSSVFNLPTPQIRANAHPPYPVHQPHINGPGIFAPMPTSFAHLTGQPFLQAPFRLSATGTPRASTPVGGLRSLSVPAPSRQPSPPTYERLWGVNGLYNQLAHTHQALQAMQRQLYLMPPVRLGEPLAGELLQQLNHHRFDVDLVIVQIEATVMRPNVAEDQLIRIHETATQVLARARVYFSRVGNESREGGDRSTNPSRAEPAPGVASAIPSLPTNFLRTQAMNVNAVPPGVVLPPGHRVESLSPQTQLLVLSGPNGPYALLVGPSGRFTTPLPSSVFPAPTATSPPDRQLPDPWAADAVPPPQGQQQPQQDAQPQADGQNPANPQERLLGLELDVWFNHLWTIIKLFILVYFFSGHGGWRRPVLLTIGATIVFLAQIGVFRGQWFDRIRRHFENLLPLEAQQQGQNQAQNQNQAGDQQGAAGAVAGAAGAAAGAGPEGQARQQPTPEETAARLVREHQERDAHWLRQHFRTAERGVALFFASLWPGVGERAVAARRREDEERRRLLEPPQQPPQNDPQAESSTTDGADAGASTPVAAGGPQGEGSSTATGSSVGGEGQPRERNPQQQRPQVVEV